MVIAPIQTEISICPTSPKGLRLHCLILVKLIATLNQGRAALPSLCIPVSLGKCQPQRFRHAALRFEFPCDCSIASAPRTPANNASAVCPFGRFSLARDRTGVTLSPPYPTAASQSPTQGPMQRGQWLATGYERSVQGLKTASKFNNSPVSLKWRRRSRGDDIEVTLRPLDEGSVWSLGQCNRT